MDRVHTGGSHVDILTEIERRLLRDAYLFDDEAAYRAGVSDAIELVRRQTADLRVVPDRLIDLRVLETAGRARRR